MKIRIKIFLIVLVVFTLVFFGVSKIVTKIEVANFEKLEKNAVTDKVMMAQAALNGKFEDLSVKLSDWSQWDDTYAFVDDKNQDYIDANLNPNSLLQLRINFIVIKNEKGEIVSEQYVNDQGNETSMPRGLEDFFSQSNSFENKQNSSLLRKAGIIDVPEGQFIGAIQSITSSDGSAPAKGVIAFGYVIDDKFIKSLSDNTHLNLSYAVFKDGDKSMDFMEARTQLSLENPIYIEKPLSANKIAGTVLMSDIFGEPSSMFRVEMSREIYALGQNDIKLLNVAILGMGIFKLILILILFEFFVLRKIDKLVLGVKSIGSNIGNGGERLVFKGSDEFSQLSHEINDMIDAISEAVTEKKESESRFIRIADTAPVMIWISDVSNKIVYVNKTLSEFLGKSESELFGDAWTNVIHPDDSKMVLEAYDDAAKKQAPLSIKYRVMCGDKKYRWILVEASVRLTPKGVFKGYTGVAVDVTEFKESDQRKEAYIQEMERMNKLMISRELKMIELKKELKEFKTASNSGK